MKARPHRTPHRRPSLRRRGFTLLEIIVVVTIIALLATLVAPRLIGQIGRSKHRVAQSEVASIAQQVSLWMVDNGFSRLPDDFDLEMLTEGADATLDADDLTDPWDRPYVLVNPGEHNPDFDIVSYAEDGEPGGADTDEDIVN